MRGAPQVGFSTTMRKMSSRSSLLAHFLPARARLRESQVQYALNPARCHRTTVSGWTRISASFHPRQSRRKTTQNNRSDATSRGCGCRLFKTASCCRSAAALGFPKAGRVGTERVGKPEHPGVSAGVTSGQFYTQTDEMGFKAHLIDSTADRYFGEPQPGETRRSRRQERIRRI